MSLSDIKINRIDELYDIVETALDERARVDETIETIAVGQSMWPTIRSGDRIVIDATKIDELKAGDVIAFGKGSFLVCHRIKEVRERDGIKYFITIGDAHEKPDDFIVETGEVAGKVVKVIPPALRIRIYFHMKMALKTFLKCLGLYGISKKIFFKVVRNRVKYIFSIPRTGSTHPANRFVDIPIECVKDGTSEFFRPLDSIGSFRITASLGKTRIAKIEIYKSRCDKDRSDLWVVSNLRITDAFCGSGLDEEMMKACRLILEKIGVKKPMSASGGTIFLPFPTVFQEVSFIHGGLVDGLTDRDYKIVVLVNDERAREKFLRFFHSYSNITVEMVDQVVPKWKRPFFGMISGALSYKNINNLAPITRRRVEKNSRFIVKLFSQVAPESALVWIQNSLLTIRQYDRLFLRYKPSLVVLSDSGNINLNRYLSRSARRFNVRVIAAEQSIDDPEICSRFPILDKTCAWGKDMEEELMRYHRYPEKNISVVGLLRGDIYKKESLLMKKDEFFRKNGLDLDKKLITIITTPSDPHVFCDMAKSILKYSSEGRIHFPLQIYIRPTPYQYRLKDTYLGEFIDNPLVHIGEPFPMQGTDVIPREAAGLLVNLVRHSDLLINILSTLTIEACLVDVPVINIAFNGVEGIFDYEYAKRIIATGGTSLVKNMPELIEAVNTYLKDPAYKRDGRKDIVKRFCYSDDGGATKRVLDIIGDYVC